MNSPHEGGLAPRLVNAKQAAMLLGIGLRKLWELTNCRDVPSVRIGRAVRYDLGDLDRWIEQHKSRSSKGCT